MNWWRAFFNLCWLRTHDHQTIVDCDARRAFQCCTNCGHSFQYDFQAELPKNFIGFIDKAHSCGLCGGWRPRDWDRCANEICTLNPDGPLRMRPDGSIGHNLDSGPNCE